VTPGGNSPSASFAYDPSNSSPVAGADGLNRLDDTRVAKIGKFTLLSNDTDPDNDSLTITTVGNALPTGSTVTLVGAFVVYTAPTTNSGNGSFTYTLSDGTGGHSVIATVAVTQIAASTVSPPGDGRPNSAAIAHIGNDFVLRFIGVSGHSYRIQYSTSSGSPYLWNDFEPPADHTTPENGVFSHTDFNPANPTRLYRAIPTPR